ncbi:hypothetical protein V1522DRAFT_412884, partial [Lipomyces starkeyi]
NQGFSLWITNRTGEQDIGINSCQNGLMQSNVHQLFDRFKSPSTQMTTTRYS